MKDYQFLTLVVLAVGLIVMLSVAMVMMSGILTVLQQNLPMLGMLVNLPQIPFPPMAPIP